MHVSNLIYRGPPPNIIRCTTKLTGASVATGQIILLTNESILVDYVQLLARRQLFATHDARETLEMEDFVKSASHQVVRRDP